MNNGWYVAEPDGAIWGPYPLSELKRAAAARAFATGSLVWHVTLGEWQPLTRQIGNASHEPPNSVASRESSTPIRSTSSASRPQRRASPPPLGKQAPLPKSHATIQSHGASTKPVSDPTGVAIDTAATARKFAWIVKRFIARYIDALSVGLFGASAWWATTEGKLGIEAPTPADLGLLLLLATGVWFVAESLLIGLFGITPGKWLMGLRVRDPHGNAPGLARAIRRSFAVYARGLAFGLLIFTPITILIAGVQTLSKGQAPWDQGLHVEDNPAILPWPLAGLLIVMLWVAAIHGWWLQLALALIR